MIATGKRCFLTGHSLRALSPPIRPVAIISMIDHSHTHMPHPYLEGLTVLGLLCGLFGLLAAGTYALALSGWIVVGWVMLPAVMLGMWALLFAT